MVVNGGKCRLRGCDSRFMTAVVAFSLSAICGVGAAKAQDRSVPFKVQPVGDQVVNGVLIQGGYVPVWTDQSGRPGGRAPAIAQTAELNSQSELDELARFGRDQGVATTVRRRQPPPAPVEAPAVSIATSVKATRSGPAFDVVAADDFETASPKTATLVRKRPALTDEEELAALESRLASVQDEVSRKQKEIEARKKDAERRAEEVRLAAEREQAKQKLTFVAKEGQLLSEAVSAYVGQNGWQNVEWNVGPDFRIKYAYSERPNGNETLKEMLKKVLKPYNLSAELYRPNSVVEIFQSDDKANR